MRKNSYLREQLNNLCEKYFPEIDPQKDVVISFGRRAGQRLGSIKREVIRPGLKMGRILIRPITYGDLSIVTITGYFRDEQVPEYVVLGTIAHELVHYVHGFSSPRPQLYDHPHKGKVVQRELIKRGLGDIHYDSEKWLKKNWRNYVFDQIE
jgi:hypothetical protein